MSKLLGALALAVSLSVLGAPAVMAGDNDQNNGHHRHHRHHRHHHCKHHKHNNSTSTPGNKS